MLVLGPLLVLLIGLLAGAYPVFGLARWAPVHRRQKSTAYSLSQTGIRKMLVVFQFTIAVGAVAATLIVHHQLAYLQQKDPGYDHERVLVIRFPPANARLFSRLREDLLRSTATVKVGAAAHPMGKIASVLLFYPEGWNEVDGRVVANYLAVDRYFLDVMNLDVAVGKQVCANDTAGGPAAFLINEAAVKEFGLQNSLGKSLIMMPEGRRGYIAGVLKDFNYAPLFEAVNPLVVGIDHSAYQYIFVKLKGQAISETLAFIEDRWQKSVPGYPNEYFFQEDYFNSSYQQQEQLYQTLRYIAGLAVCIADLGLFSLSAFITQRRKKEIGVRKVLGASTADIIILLSRDFIKLVLLGNLIAGPLVWYVVTKWLECFPDHIEVGGKDYAVTAAISMAIALAALSAQVIKAATANPTVGLQLE